MIMMNRGAKSNVMTEITEDLIIEIFLRLPQKSVSRFLCLSKQWKSIICGQYFTDLFLTMSLSKPHLLILRERNYELESKLFSSHYPLPSYPVATSFFRAKLSEYHIPDKGYFEGSYASGLIYFPGDGERHGICNPSTGKYAILPPIKHSYGLLGYDPIGKQFKVLLCKEKRDDDLVYQVLTLGTKNERQMEIKRPLPNGYYISDHICINGVLYLFYKGIRGDFIDCFDVRCEEFFMFEYPESPGVVGNFFKNFVNYKGKLGLVETFPNYKVDLYGNYTDYCLEITIWVLEDSDKVEWTKHFYKVWDLMPYGITPNSATNNVSVIGVTDEGNIILAKTFARKPFYVFFFNPSDPWKLRRVEIEEYSDHELYKIHYFMNHKANLGFDIMKKTTYAETHMYEPARTDASTSSSNDN